MRFSIFSHSPAYEKIDMLISINANSQLASTHPLRNTTQRMSSSSLPPSSSPLLPESDSDSDISLGSTSEPLTMKVFIRNDKERSKIHRAGVEDRMNIVWSDSLEALQALDVPDTDSTGWIPVEHSLETLKRLFPKVKSKPRNISEYKLLFCFRDTSVEGKFWLKGAVQHRKTGKVAMLTAYLASQISPPEPGRKRTARHESHADGWYVVKADMYATACFWNAFKVC